MKTAASAAMRRTEVAENCTGWRAPPGGMQSVELHGLETRCGAGAGDALLADAVLARLEAELRQRAGDPDARVADFFDVAAGVGTRPWRCWHSWLGALGRTVPRRV